MPVKYQRVWDTMNDLETIISKVVSAREMIDVANEALEYNQKERAQKLTMAAYEFLGYFIEEFDEKFKDAWQATVGDLREGDVRETYSCDKNDQSPECKNAWNDFWEQNYYPEEYGSQYTDEELDAMCEAAKKDEVKKWILPVEVDAASGEYYLMLPDDLLEKVNFVEGDELRWVDNNDGSFTIRKVTRTVGMGEC